MIRQYKQEKDRLPDCNLPSVEAVPGFEHGDTGLADHCLTAWLHRHKITVIVYRISSKSKSDFIILYDTFLSIFINCNLHIIIEMIDTLFKERLSMNFTYEFPDITGYIQKAALIKSLAASADSVSEKTGQPSKNVSPFLSPAVMKIKILITLPFL